jgi:diguanylate cyclase (GGDEF)-like protein
VVGVHPWEDRRRDARLPVAEPDPVNGLPNRRRLQELIGDALDAGEQVGVLVIAIDRFSAMNEAYGYRVGDAVLRELAARWSALLPARDTLAHLGANAFCVVMRSMEGEARAMAAAQRLQDTLRAPIRIDGATLKVSASMGVSLGPHDGREPWSLVQCATLATHRAQQQPGRVVRFTLDHWRGDPRTLLVLNDLRDALAEGQLRLQYQPKVRLRDMRVIGVEALLRWEHPVNGRVPPGEFIPLVEHTELMPELTRHVLRMAH